MINNNNQLSNEDKIITFSQKDIKIAYGRRAYNVNGIKYGPIWIRLTKAEIFTKGLYLLDNYILNAYKNLFEDRWWNTIANNVSYSYLMINRIGYIYVNGNQGEGKIRHGNTTINEKYIKELILFILFDYNLAYVKSDKKKIVKKLRSFDKGKYHVKLSDLKQSFPPYNYLLNLLINDKYVSNSNKQFLLTLQKKIKGLEKNI